MYIVNHRGLFFTITGIILAIAVGSIIFFGLPLSIDFTGGSLVEVRYDSARPSIDTIKHDVDQLALGDISLRESGDNGVILRSRTLTPAEHEEVLAALSGHAGTSASSTATTTAASLAPKVASSTVATASSTAGLTELRFTSIGPSLGSELAKKALESPRVKASFEQQGATAFWMTPKDTGAYRLADEKKLAPVIKASGARVE